MTRPRVRSSYPRGQDVLDPVGVRAVGQGQDIAVLGGEHIDRRLIQPPGAPTTVDDYTEAGHPGGDVPGHPVQPGLVPLPDDPRNGHAASLIRACSPGWPTQSCRTSPPLHSSGAFHPAAGRTIHTMAKPRFHDHVMSQLA